MALIVSVESSGARRTSTTPVHIGESVRLLGRLHGNEVGTQLSQAMGRFSPISRQSFRPNRLSWGFRRNTLPMEQEAGPLCGRGVAIPERGPRGREAAAFSLNKSTIVSKRMDRNEKPARVANGPRDSKDERNGCNVRTRSAT